MIGPGFETIVIPNMCDHSYCSCIGVRKVSVYEMAWNQEKQQILLLRRLLCHDLMPELNVLYALFPNLESIHINTTRHFHFHLEQMVLDGTLSFISSTGKHSALRQITIKKPEESRLSIRDAIQQNGYQFDSVGWSIEHTQDRWKDKFLIIRKQ